MSGRISIGREAFVTQSDQNRHPNLLPLFSLALIVLLIFAWTYI